MATVSTPTARFEHLAKTFPCLRRAPGLDPWRPNTLDRWAASPSPSQGERVTARFLLTVWSPDEAWESGRFVLTEALRVWDVRHRRAFLIWASAPWWP